MCYNKYASRKIGDNELLNKDIMDLYKFEPFLPEGKFLSDVLDAFERPKTSEEFMEAYCVLFGLPIAKEKYSNYNFFCEDNSSIDMNLFKGPEIPVNRYGLPDRIKLIQEDI